MCKKSQIVNRNYFQPENSFDKHFTQTCVPNQWNEFLQPLQVHHRTLINTTPARVQENKKTEHHSTFTNTSWKLNNDHLDSRFINTCNY